MHHYTKECDTLITTEDFDKVKQSKPYINGHKALITATAGKQLSRDEFAAARDQLIYKLSIETLHYRTAVRTEEESNFWSCKD